MGSNNNRDWLLAVISFAAAIGVNALLLAYTYGKMEQRVTALEQQREITRAEWKAARDRIERAIDKLEAK